MSLSTESCSEKYIKKLAGRSNIEDALVQLDRLTQEEALMAAVQSLKVTHDVDDKVQGVDDRVRDVDDKLDMVIVGV